MAGIVVTVAVRCVDECVGAVAVAGAGADAVADAAAGAVAVWVAAADAGGVSGGGPHAVSFGVVFRRRFWLSVGRPAGSRSTGRDRGRAPCPGAGAEATGTPVRKLLVAARMDTACHGLALAAHGRTRGWGHGEEAHRSLPSRPRRVEVPLHRVRRVLLRGRARAVGAPPRTARNREPPPPQRIPSALGTQPPLGWVPTSLGSQGGWVPREVGT